MKPQAETNEKVEGENVLPPRDASRTLRKLHSETAESLPLSL